jgi:tetratricopeptide (TPR) repeat protein
MKRRKPFTPWWLALALVCGGSAGADMAGHSRPTTAGVIAVANLDHQIAQLRDNAGAEELLLARSRFLGDYDALDRAVSMADRRVRTGDDLMRRARTRSAVHRFADALVDLDAAERTGADGAQVAALRASILIATGHADEAIPGLENELSNNPGYASRSSLATAYAAAGRIADADRLYAAALADLDTTSPFPYAWLYFARGMMWAEQAGDPRRGEAFYARALVKLPEFATANIHLAELEAARGDLSSATARLRRVAAASNEPEALALLGELRLRLGDRLNGLEDIENARRRYESLLDRHPLAFADHAAEFYLGPGDDAERAWMLAKKNLANRETPRAFAIAIDAARATGRDHDARVLAANARAKSVD